MKAIEKIISTSHMAQILRRNTGVFSARLRTRGFERLISAQLLPWATSEIVPQRHAGTKEQEAGRHPHTKLDAGITEAMYRRHDESTGTAKEQT